VIDKTVPFHIATLHGTLYGNQAHDPYAPFQLSDLQAKDFDYWGLGHIHQREILSTSPTIIYPGNIQGRHRHETDEKGCYYVELTKTTTQTEFVPLQAIEFSSVKVDVTTCENIDDVERIIMKSIGNTNAYKLIDLTISSHNRHIHTMEAEGLIQELIDILNESAFDLQTWQYIYQYRIEGQFVETNVNNHFFIGELADTLEEMSLRETLADLYRHRTGRKFLDDLAEADIKQAAKNELFHRLLKSGGQ